MSNLILQFFIFNLFTGLLIALPIYFWKEKRVRDWKGFLLLILLPFIGWGNWEYKRMRPGVEKEVNPRAAVILTRTAIFNIVFLLILLFIYLGSHNQRQSQVGEGMKWASEQDNPAAVGVGVVTDVGIMTVEGTMGFFDFLGFVLLFFVLLFFVVILPLIIATALRYDAQKEALRRRLAEADPPPATPKKR